MDIGLRGEEKGVEKVGDEGEEDESAVYVPSSEDVLKLGIELLESRRFISCHDGN